MAESIELRDLVVAAAFLVGGFAIGYLVYRVVAALIRRERTLTRLGTAATLASAAHRAALVGFTLAGIFGAVQSLPFRQDVADPINAGLRVVAVVAGTVVVARLAGDLVKVLMLRSGGAAVSGSIFITMTRLIVYLIGLLLLLQMIGVSITPLLTALGVGGLAVALALQDTLANLFAGFHILASKKVQPGDFIRLDSGEDGYVVDINWRNTTVRQIPNNMVIVPNARLASAIVTNFHRPVRELSVLVQVGVSYASDLEQVERVTIETATEVMKEVPGGVPSFEPFIRYHTFGESSIDFTVILRAHEYRDQHLLKHEFVKRLHERYRAEGIEIPFPIRTVHLRDAQGDGAGLPTSR